MSDPNNDAPDAPTQPQTPYSYSPPTEPRSQWAAPGWAQGSPPHWFEPLPGQERRRQRRGRSGAYVAVLFVVAMLGSLVGSALTYGALLSTGQLRSTGNNVAASPTPLPAASSTPGPHLGDDSTAITSAAEQVSPAVVTITVESAAATDPLSLPETGIGSGIIYDSAGWILTNRHVVADATTVTVDLNDGRQVTGTVYGVDTLTDLAIVKIDAPDLHAAPMGDSAQLQPGETAIVIGSALGTFTNSVTSGVISALGRTLAVTDPLSGERRRLRNLIQTDAAINPGNSGGPLVDGNGQVIGVSTAYAEGAQGIFFAIPINIAKPIMAQAVAGKELTRPWIGIIYIALDKSVATENGISIDYGAWLAPDTGTGESPVKDGSPAAAAGLLANDIITSINGARVDSSQGLDDLLSNYEPGERLTLGVLRNGETLQIGITLGVRPAGLE
ncbi:MAG TPA: trypsin-like peptidase domain-containing protein [Candidatus Limnocylindria bacterium]|nr:trypsin-like peptidase domain-containing protein [Candidatus Limnocylindria bacterium]